MQSDFSATARTARAAIPVPGFPVERIRARAHAATTQARTRLAALVTALVLAGVGVQAGLAEKLFHGVRVWLSGEKAAVAVDSFAMVSFPTPDDLRAVVAHATFPVVLPVGLPPQTRVLRVFAAPAGRPTYVMLEYLKTGSASQASFSLVDTNALGTGTPSIPGVAVTPEFRPVARWTVGGETVLVPPKYDEGRGGRMQAAMRESTPAQSLAQNEAHAWRITVIGGRIDVAVRADRLAAGSRAVLLDSGHLRWIPQLLKQRRPMPDGRFVEVTHVPYAHGEPDYRHATLHFRRTVAVPLGGLRAIEAAMRAAHTTAECRCEVLFEPASAGTYSVSTIPFSASDAVRRYAVDVRSLAVTPQR